MSTTATATATTTTQTLPPSHVHIVGGGLGGLTLARVLQLSSIPCTVYEREPNATSRAQGGTLDMHGESGQKALRMAGLYELFEEQCSRLADTMIIRGKDGEVAWMDGPPEEHGPPPPPPSSDGADGEHDGGPPDEGRPEIDRGILRQILLDSLKPGTIQWDHMLRSITSTPTGLHELVFSHQSTSTPSTSTTVTAEFVVGADGAWSRTRSILSPTIPHYTGVIFIESELLDVDARFPSIAELVGDGTMMATAENKGVIVQRNSGGRMKAYLALRVPSSWIEEDSQIPLAAAAAAADPEGARARLLELFDGWSEGLRDVIRCAEPRFILRQLVALDPEMRWEGKEGITLLGDAAHVMSPFAGEGANLAMLDAAELGYALAGKGAEGEKGKWVGEVVGGYEARMFKRSEAAAKESAMNMDVFMSDMAPWSAADRMREMMSAGPPPS